MSRREAEEKQRMAMRKLMPLVKNPALLTTVYFAVWQHVIYPRCNLSPAYFAKSDAK
jgi:hypothetical protein